MFDVQCSMLEVRLRAKPALAQYPGAQIMAGLRPGADEAAFRDALKSNRFENVLHAQPVQADEAYFIPGGRLHAICEGCLLMEIQQSSDTTYRVYDWGRVDHDGTPRELHIEQALRVIRWDDPPAAPLKARRLAAVDGNGWREILRCDYFVLRHVDLNQPVALRMDGNTFHAIFTRAGGCTIETVAGETHQQFSLWRGEPPRSGGSTGQSTARATNWRLQNPRFAP
jgi:mannose-6-phosphate isomerase